MRPIFILLSFIAFITTPAYAVLPTGFVYLQDIDPSIVQEMRYTTAHNFMGRPVAGYKAATCILTKPAALALSQVQQALKKSALSLKVYDCYRPQQAVDEFIQWSQQPKQQQMKAEFYPRVNKADVFKLGYVAEKSDHTRGSTVDLTLVPQPTPSQKNYTPTQKLVACFAEHSKRFPDNSIDMGTGFDCFDVMAHNDNDQISAIAWHNRQLLKTEMEKYGFNAYQSEWWHFTLKNEPYPDTYFNFPVE